jgi:hypothetical protein
MKVAVLVVALLLGACDDTSVTLTLPPGVVDVECVRVPDTEPNVCRRMFEAVQVQFAVEVAAAARVVIVDTCPPRNECDRDFLYDAAALIVPADDSGAALIALHVFGHQGQEVMVEAWRGPLPQHIRQVLAG